MLLNDLILKLQYSSPEYVFDWLSKSNDKDSEYTDSKLRERIETALYERKDKLINLGLALYGITESIAVDIYQNGDRSIKYMPLSGYSISLFFLVPRNWVVYCGVIKELLEKYDTNEKDAFYEGFSRLLRNPRLSRSFLEELYDKSGVFENASDEAWLKLIELSIGNDQLKSEYYDEYDPMGMYGHEELYRKLYALYEKLPVSDWSAYVLRQLVEESNTGRVDKVDIERYADRWRKDGRSYDDARRVLVKAYFRRGCDATDSQGKSLFESDDLAIRQGVYSYFTDWTVELIQSSFQRDSKDFLDFALFNDDAYREPEVRDVLSQCCWDAPDEHSSMTYPATYRNVRDRIEDDHPEWFVGEIMEGYFENTKDFNVRLELKIDHLRKEVDLIKSEGLRLDKDFSVGWELSLFLEKFEGFKNEVNAASTVKFMIGVVMLIMMIWILFTH